MGRGTNCKSPPKPPSTTLLPPPARGRSWFLSELNRGCFCPCGGHAFCSVHFLFSQRVGWILPTKPSQTSEQTGMVGHMASMHHLQLLGEAGVGWGGCPSPGTESVKLKEGQAIINHRACSCSQNNTILYCKEDYIFPHVAVMLKNIGIWYNR